MSTDFSTLVVAVVSVVGALGGTVLTQRAGFREKRLELSSRQAEASAQTDAARRAEKQALYAELNATARAFRSTSHDCVRSLTLDDEGHPTNVLDVSLLAGLRAVRATYRDVYARAQMVLAEPTLEIASEVNACLGLGFTIVQTFSMPLPSSRDNPLQLSFEQLLGRAFAWFDGPSSDAVWLLRRALRAELGVSDPPKPSEENRLRMRRHAERVAWRRPD